jgi:hypothetical protein
MSVAKAIDAAMIDLDDVPMAAAWSARIELAL